MEPSKNPQTKQTPVLRFAISVLLVCLASITTEFCEQYFQFQMRTIDTMLLGVFAFHSSGFLCQTSHLAVKIFQKFWRGDSGSPVPGPSENPTRDTPCGESFWKCQGCRSKIPAGMSRCTQCGRERPKEKPELWKCPKCWTTFPDGKPAVCIVCSLTDHVVQQKPWICSECGWEYRTYRKQGVCQVCLARKAEQLLWKCPWCEQMNDRDRPVCSRCTHTRELGGKQNA